MVGLIITVMVSLSQYYSTGQISVLDQVLIVICTINVLYTYSVLYLLNPFTVIYFHTSRTLLTLLSSCQDQMYPASSGLASQ